MSVWQTMLVRWAMSGWQTKSVRLATPTPASRAAKSVQSGHVRLVNHAGSLGHVKLANQVGSSGQLKAPHQMGSVPKVNEKSSPASMSLIHWGIAQSASSPSFVTQLPVAVTASVPTLVIQLPVSVTASWVHFTTPATASSTVCQIWVALRDAIKSSQFWYSQNAAMPRAAMPTVIRITGPDSPVNNANAKPNAVRPAAIPAQ